MNVGVTLPLQNGVDCWLGNPELTGERGLPKLRMARNVRSLDLKHLLLVQLRMVMAKATILPELGVAVSRVVCSSSKKQMGRVAAKHVVAGMTDEQTVWNVSMDKRPCEAVSEPVLIPVMSLPVPPTPTRHRPLPALSGVANIHPTPEIVRRVSTSWHTYLLPYHYTGVLA